MAREGRRVDHSLATSDMLGLTTRNTLETRVDHEEYTRGVAIRAQKAWLEG